MAIIFNSGDQEYFEWMKANPEGFILNTERRENTVSFILHRSNCAHITAYPSLKNGAYTMREWVKVGSNDVADIVNYCRANKQNFHDQFKICKSCKPEFVINGVSNSVSESVSFFTKDDLEFFSKYANTLYRRGNAEQESAGARIKNSIFEKTNIWADSLNLQGWKIEEDNRWQLSGTFKPYSWARIYKEKDQNSKVYFTVGVEGKGKALVYKIDCQHNQYNAQNALTQEQVDAFNTVVGGTQAQWNEIKADELEKYDWERLQRITDSFIQKYESLYNDAVKAVLFANPKQLSFALPEEFLQGGADDHFEGLKRTITVNAYERNQGARDECIKYWKAVCAVCSFDFEKAFGNIGKGYIHVHHLKPIHQIGEMYKVDPIKDLIPVCPNCHAMIHKRKKPFSIGEMKEILKK